MSDSNIPSDILVEIMKRLPAKSLIRFKSVSKPCKSLIHSSKFIADHQQHSTQHGLFVSYVNLEKPYKEEYVSILDDDTFPQHKFPLTVPDLLYKPTIMVGCSRGLFCFYHNGTNAAVIWNPSIRKSVDIHVPNLIDGGVLYTSVLGFGVSPHTCDPKLVKITFVESCDEIKSEGSIPQQVEVFTLSSRGWKSLSINLPRKFWFSTDNVDIDGVIFWAVADRFYLDGELQLNNMIMSFDLTTEKFTEIYLPDYLRIYQATWFPNKKIEISIYKLRESLAVVKCRFPTWKQVYDVWMMENGDPKSFTKLYTIAPPEGEGSMITGVLGFNKSGKPIVVVIKGHIEPDALYVYEPNSKQFTYIGISMRQDLHFAVSYMETLLLIDH